MVFLLPLPLPKFRLGMDIDDGGNHRQTGALRQRNHLFLAGLYKISSQQPQTKIILINITVSAFMNQEGADSLPLFGYSAVFAQDGELYVAAVPTDEDSPSNPKPK